MKRIFCLFLGARHDYVAALAGDGLDGDGVVVLVTVAEVGVVVGAPEDIFLAVVGAAAVVLDERAEKFGRKLEYIVFLYVDLLVGHRKNIVGQSYNFFIIYANQSCSSGKFPFGLGGDK